MAGDAPIKMRQPKKRDRARKAEQVMLYMHQVGRTARRGALDPNDRNVDAKARNVFLNTDPFELSELLDEGDEDPCAS